MKSLATIFLVFLTCLAVAGTIALVDRAQSVLYPSAEGATQVSTAHVNDAAGAVRLAEFATDLREKFALPQPADLVVFDDVRRGDANYASAQAVYPFLHRQLLCPECALSSSFSPNESVTRAQAAVVLVSILSAQDRVRLLSPEQTTDVLSQLDDADAVSPFARPYIATAVANGLLAPRAGNMLDPTQPYLRTEMAAFLDTVQHRFPPFAATASLHLAGGSAR
ncbi:MAG TPA: S-layer homology domain-containing protein [Acidobacteriaceae bacterium]